MTLTNLLKSATSFTNSGKTTTAMDNGVSYLLKEDTFFLLLENGGKIILDQSPRAKNLTTLVNRTK